MPTYQYTCTDCGDQVEAVQRFTDAPLSICRSCGGRLRKVFSPVGIVFKGSGFYRTDNRNGSSAAAAGKKDKQPGDSGSAATPAESGDGPAGTPAAKKSGGPAGSSSKSSPAGEKVA